jgi:hypothetical protein
MIYEAPDPRAPIKQGDIFQSIPQMHFDPENLLVIRDGLTSDEGNWIDESNNQTVRVIARVEPVYGIVVTQDCDAERDKYVAFFLVSEFFEVTKLTPPKKLDAQWWAKKLPERVRTNQKWFYLPADKTIGFSQKMAVDFQTIIRVQTRFLLNNKGQLRIGRLNHVADEHFREHVAQYFRRYPYNEWYPFTKEEFESYKEQASRKDTPPYSWQE